MATTDKAKAANAVEATSAVEPPAVDAKAAAEPAAEETAAARRFDPRKMVTVYNAETGDELPNKVPETWLDGRFPQLTDTQPQKEGK